MIGLTLAHMWVHNLGSQWDKGPVRFLEKQIKKYDRINNLETMAIQTPNICKWTRNEDIDRELSNEIWNNPSITDKQKSCLIKFCTGTYMGQAIKQTFFGRQRFPTITCPICNSHDLDTWLHVLLTCRQQHIHSLHVKRHNKAIWEIKKLLISPKNPDATLSRMLAPLMTTPKKTLSRTGYYHAHVEPKDVNVTLNLDPTFFALKGYHIKMNPPQI